MKKLLVAASVLAAFALASGSVYAQDGEPKKNIEIKIKINPEMFKKLQGKIGGGGQIDPETLSKFLEKIAEGKFDPELMLKMLDKVGGGNGMFNSEMAKKLMAIVAKGAMPKVAGKFDNIDADALFKKLDANGDGKLSKKEFMKVLDEFKEQIGEGQMGIATLLVGQWYDQMDPTGNGLTPEQFRKGVAEFQKKMANK
jgi:hypothetical protein